MRRLAEALSGTMAMQDSEVLLTAAKEWASWVLDNHKGVMVERGLAVSIAISAYLSGLDDSEE